MRVLMYYADCHAYGGITTFVKNFVRRMNDKIDITFVYEQADSRAIDEISKFVKVEKINSSSTYTTDIFLIVSSWGKPIFNKVNYGTCCCMIHANLESYALMDLFKMKPDERINYFISVSEDVQGAFKRLHKLDSTVIYNLL